MIWIKRFFHNIYLNYNRYEFRRWMKFIFTWITIIVLCIAIIGCIIIIIHRDANIDKESIGFYGEVIYNENNIEYRRDLVTDQVFIVRYSMYSTTIKDIIDPDTGLPMLYDKFMEIVESRGGFIE